MTWRELPPLATDVAAQLPEFPELCLVAGHIVDCREGLWPEERTAIARARERRAMEFATGRELARQAMIELGLSPGAVARAQDRSPVWPPSVMGSITHAGELAIAAVARTGSYAGIGIDLEDASRVTEPMFPKLFTDAELERLDQVPGERPNAVRLGARSASPRPKAVRLGARNASPRPNAPDRERLPGLLFSAKEAAYKAVYPQVGRFIGFQEAEVDVDWPARTLRLRYVGDHPPNRIMNDGQGHFCFFGDFVLTVFVIPRR